MHLTVITPDKQLFEGEVSLVQLPGTQGLFAVLPGHDKLIATLEAGEIRVVQQDTKPETEMMIPIKGGVVEVNQDKLLVLAD